MPFNDILKEPGYPEAIQRLREIQPKIVEILQHLIQARKLTLFVGQSNAVKTWARDLPHDEPVTLNMKRVTLEADCIQIHTALSEK